MKTLFQPHTELVGKVMNLQLERQNVITSNLANIKTPGYKPREVSFEAELQQALGSGTGALRRTDPRHLPSGFDPNTFSSDVSEKFKPRMIHGEDRVDIDKEMAKMAKNALQYNALTQVISKNYEGLRTIIQEGQK